MPSKPQHPCGKPGCNILTRVQFCDTHVHIAHQAERNRHKQYDLHQRNKQATAFYHSIEWDRVRRQRLAIDHGLCQDCLREQRVTPADVVDHIKPIEWYWELRLSVGNLQSLCHAHHNAKTAEDKRRYKGRQG